MIGRPDFGGGDAATQFESVMRLLRLPDWVAVLPGHFEEPCGNGMCGGRPSTTVGFERLYNPLLHLERGPFVSNLTNGVPARPLNMIAIEGTNRGLANIPQAMLTTSGEVAEIVVEALERLSPDAVILNVCEPEEYAHGHVPGAINVSQADLASELDELPRNRPILAICRGGSRITAGGTISRAGGLRSGGERQRWHRRLACGG